VPSVTLARGSRVETSLAQSDLRGLQIAPVVGQIEIAGLNVRDQPGKLQIAEAGPPVAGRPAHRRGRLFSPGQNRESRWQVGILNGWHLGLQTGRERQQRQR
jgi:hypothetical protein